MDIEKLAVEAGVIVVDEQNTYWTENNAIEVLDKFAKLVIEDSKRTTNNIEDTEMTNMELDLVNELKLTPLELMEIKHYIKDVPELDSEDAWLGFDKADSGRVFDINFFRGEDYGYTVGLCIDVYLVDEQGSVDTSRWASLMRSGVYLL